MGFSQSNDGARDCYSRGSTPWTNHGFSRAIEEHSELSGNENGYGDEQILVPAFEDQLSTLPIPLGIAVG